MGGLCRCSVTVIREIRGLVEDNISDLGLNGMFPANKFIIKTQYIQNVV